MTLNSSLLGAIRGPLLLITLGLLLTLDHAGTASFWRTWPVLMIVFGVLKLAEHLQVGARNGSPPNAPGNY